MQKIISKNFICSYVLPVMKSYRIGNATRTEKRIEKKKTHFFSTGLNPSARGFYFKKND